MYTFERSYAEVHGCMTLFVSPGDVVGWATVRGTAPEQRKEKFRLRPILDGPMSPTPNAIFAPSYLRLPRVSDAEPWLFWGVLGFNLPVTRG